MNTKSIVVTQNHWFQLPDSHFYHATNGDMATQQTVVKLKIDHEFLFIEFNCENNPFVAENNYFEHNSEMYNQEVFELFIATGKETATRYLEIEINPNNALFVGWIENPTGEAPEKLDFIAHNDAGILHGTQKGTESWSGFISIPLALIGKKSMDYRLNFYRIISKKSQTEKDWKCDTDNCDFTCWNATLSGASPRFHRPEAFGKLKILR